MCTFNLRMMLGEQKPEGRPQSSSQWAHLISLFSRCFTYQQDTVSQGVLSACVTLIYKNAPSFNTTMVDNRLSSLNPSWKKKTTTHNAISPLLYWQHNPITQRLQLKMNQMWWPWQDLWIFNFNPTPHRSGSRLKKMKHSFGCWKVQNNLV